MHYSSVINICYVDTTMRGLASKWLGIKGSRRVKWQLHFQIYVYIYIYIYQLHHRKHKIHTYRHFNSQNWGLDAYLDVVKASSKFSCVSLMIFNLNTIFGAYLFWRGAQIIKYSWCLLGSKWDNRSHSRHKRKCILDCFGGQLDANTRISTGYAQNLPDHWD
jgi:hypothetical protein